MRNIDDVKKDLASYKALMKRQGDFTIYASKFIQDVEFLMSLLPQKSVSTAAEKAPLPGVSSSPKKRVRKPDDSKD